MRPADSQIGPSAVSSAGRLHNGLGLAWRLGRLAALCSLQPPAPRRPDDREQMQSFLCDVGGSVGLAPENERMLFTEQARIAGCASQPQGQLLVGFSAAVLLAGGTLVVLWLARRAPARESRLTAAGLALSATVAGAGSIIYSFAPLRCGRAVGDLANVASSLVGVGAGGLILLSVVERCSPWAAMAVIAVFDTSLAVSVLGSSRHANGAGLVVVMLVTHAACTTTASWWSWRAQACRLPRDVRADVGETGRVLAAAWVLVAAVGATKLLGSVSDHANSFEDSALATAFIFGAVALTACHGYTTHVKAHTSGACRHFRAVSAAPDAPVITRPRPQPGSGVRAQGGAARPPSSPA